MDFFYRGPDKATALDRLQQASLIAVDTETVSLNDTTCIGIGVYWSDMEGAYFPVFPSQAEGISVLLNKCANPIVTKIYHNGISFDLEVLDQLVEEGWPAPDDTNIEDTSIMAQVCGLPPSLERLGNEWSGANDLFSIQSLFRDYNCKNMLDVPTEITARKCLNDCRTTWQLYQSFTGRNTQTGGGRLPILSGAQRDCYEVDRQLISVLRRMQRKGLKLRPGVLKEWQHRLERSISQLRDELFSEGLDRPNSPTVVANFLSSRGNNLVVGWGRNAKLSTAEEVLEGLSDTLAAKILEWRGFTKLLSTYINPWLCGERAYTHFRLDLATGRLASGRINGWDTVNRNLQNIPPNIREVFEPENGLWTWADHSQLELRIIAHMSKDPVMLDAYTTGKDLHALTAQAAGVTRFQGKTANFADAFGGGERKLAKVLGVDIPKARQIKQAKDRLYQVATIWKIELQQEYGEYAETLFGRRCRLPQKSDQPQWAYWSDKKWEAHVGSCNVNFRVQGTGADILKRGILLLDKMGLDERLSVHDEHLIDGDVEIPKELEFIHPELQTPFEVKKGVSWT